MGNTRRLGSGAVGSIFLLAAAACGGATETTDAEKDAGAAALARPADCPRFVVLKSATRELSRDATCELHANGKISRGFTGTIFIAQPECASICADPQLNQCSLPEGSSALVTEKRNPEDGGQGPCPLSEAAGPTQVTCYYGEWQGTRSPGCPSD